MVFSKNKLLEWALIVALGIGVDIWIHQHFSKPIISTTVVGGVSQVKVESPTLNPTTIDRVVADPAQQEVINNLLKVNNDLKLKLTQLNSTVATSKTTGGTAKGGNLVQGNQNSVRLESNPNKHDPEAGTKASDQVVQPNEFKDYQLDARYTADAFNYTLTQSFRVVSSLGRDKDGNQVGLVKLFQDTPKGQVEIPTQTTIIFTTPAGSRFIVSPRIQAGVGFNPSKGGLVAFQWFKHGASPAAEDVKWAFVSPAVYFNGTGVTPVLLPVSFNLGSIKHNPLTNLWVSPFLDKFRKVGVSFTATF